MSAEHIVLLGDSIFDNGLYSHPDPDVASHLVGLLPPGWRVTNCARDGATIATVSHQISSIPSDATYLVASIGGNDALEHRSILSDQRSRGIDTLTHLAKLATTFLRDYTTAIREVLTLNRPTCVCTVYNGDLQPQLKMQAQAALAVFNDCIYRAASILELPVIELREVCTHREDYFGEIEPSGTGGIKIAQAILTHLKKRAIGLRTKSAAP